MFLLDAKFFQKLFQIQCFLNCCCHALIFCFLLKKNYGLFLDTQDECLTMSVEPEVRAPIDFLLCISQDQSASLSSLNHNLSFFSVSEFQTLNILQVLIHAHPLLIGLSNHASGQNVYCENDLRPRLFAQIPK